MAPKVGMLSRERRAAGKAAGIRTHHVLEETGGYGYNFMSLAHEEES